LHVACRAQVTLLPGLTLHAEPAAPDAIADNLPRSRPETPLRAIDGRSL